MAQFQNMFKVDLSAGAAPVVPLAQIYYADVEANRVGAVVLLNGEAFPLSGTCSGTAILSDGSTVALTGAIDGNRAYVDLPAGCYSVAGTIQVFVKITAGGVTTTLICAVGTVRLTETGTVIDPGTIIPSVSALIDDIDAAVASIPADYSALLAAIAPTFSNTTAYSAGTYAWYSGTLYRFTVDHAAGSWTGSDAVAVVIGAELATLKSAIVQLTDIPGDNEIALTDFTQTTNATYAVDSETNSITVTNTATGNYNGVQTTNSWCGAHLVPGRTYRLHAKAEVVSGSPNMNVCIRGKEGNELKISELIKIGTSDGEGFIDFVADSYMKYVTLFVSFGSSTNGSVAKFSEIWIKEYCTTGTDTTLTQANKAADAKTAGEKISDTNNAITKSTGNQFYNYTPDKFIDTSTSPVNINYQEPAAGYAFVIANCSPGDIFVISGRGSTLAALWTFIDDSGVIKGQSTSTTEQFNVQITAPTGATKLIAQSNKPNPKCQKGVLLVGRVSSLETKQADNDTYIEAIKIQEQFGNVFEAKITFLEGKYYYNSNGTLTIGTNAAYNGFIIPVTPNQTYTFVTSNIVLLDKDKKPINTSGSWDYESVTTCNSGNAYYFAVCYRLEIVPQAGYAISQGTSLDYGEYSIEYYAKAKATDNKPLSKSNSGAIADGGSLSVTGSSAIKDGQFISFKGKFSSFGTIKIDFAGGGTNYVSVTSANLVVSNNTDSVITESHGLTISDDIAILLELKDGKIYVSVTSKGITFKYNCVWNQTGAALTYCSAKPTGMAFTDAKLSVTYSAAKRDIWYFGDSYMQFNTDTRIPYYLQEYGYDKNAMINAVSGGTTAAALGAFQTLLNYGTPKIAVLATGMNDGSDSGSPVYGWITRVPTFISICESNGIIPVLCTIPTVPTVNNEYKNAWIKSHDYRYIDYAKAVGANASGEWYGNGTEYDMLAPDGVHPSVYGGNALFTQLITDLPEIMGE